MVRTILSLRALFKKLSCIFCAGLSIGPPSPFRESKTVTNGVHILHHSKQSRDREGRTLLLGTGIPCPHGRGSASGLFVFVLVGRSGYRRCRGDRFQFRPVQLAGRLWRLGLQEE